ncbi:hypothetical protein DQG13_06645 [Paenibacillus sp. YN15]|nr:hypothetical protein DQG13_06645 [Paenibacillus sp. YN15]
MEVYGIPIMQKYIYFMSQLLERRVIMQKVHLFHADFSFLAVLNENNCTFAGWERKRGIMVKNNCTFA